MPGRPSGRHSLGLGGVWPPLVAMIKPIGIGRESFGDQFLTSPRTVGIGGIDEGDAQFDRMSQQTSRCRPILRRTQDAWPRDPRGPKPSRLTLRSPRRNVRGVCWAPVISREQ
jgi:hypothetical protein